MRTEHEVREQLARHEQALRDWLEPDGYMVPLCPDVDERARTCGQLRASIKALEWVLDGPPRVQFAVGEPLTIRVDDDEEPST